jgi:hypothetical protein
MNLDLNLSPNQSQESAEVAPRKKVPQKQNTARNEPLAHDDPRNVCRYCDKRGFKNLNCKQSHESGCKKKQGLDFKSLKRTPGDGEAAQKCSRKKRPATKQACVEKSSVSSVPSTPIPEAERGFTRLNVVKPYQRPLAHTHSGYGVMKAMKAGRISDPAQFVPALHCLACLHNKERASR